MNCGYTFRQKVVVRMLNKNTLGIKKVRGQLEAAGTCRCDQEVT